MALTYPKGNVGSTPRVPSATNLHEQDAEWYFSSQLQSEGSDRFPLLFRAGSVHSPNKWAISRTVSVLKSGYR
jgi:hypothetical protein